MLSVFVSASIIDRDFKQKNESWCSWFSYCDMLVWYPRLTYDTRDTTHTDTFSTSLIHILVGPNEGFKNPFAVCKCIESSRFCSSFPPRQFNWMLQCEGQKGKKIVFTCDFFWFFLLFGLCLFRNVRFFDRNAISSKNHEERLKVARLLPRVLPVAESVPEVK